MNYSTAFKNLVEKAFSQSKKFYNEGIPEFGGNYKENPYYIGFGNPNADILIIGKEKAINKEKSPEAYFLESINNTFEWNEIVEKSLDRINENDVVSKFKYKDARWPYWDKKPKATWMNYQKIIEKIYPDLKKDKFNTFFHKSFITEVNHIPSLKSKNNKDFGERLDFLKHPFYQNFSVIILACGDYLTKKAISEVFDVEYVSDKFSIPYNKFILYGNKVDGRLLIQTRQLSNSLKGELLDRIAEHSKETLNKK